ncbi:tetratricopeptide repeat protein [Microbispora sp. H10670]|uniref:tetratricopeptide repeat protein n=1 Tax=Microbispora sp. H10670 TaxID=2729108 RepID=UPI001603F69C|nr:tetratricopeptide repeat protein [Microbispora sp. H10670]
MDWDAIGAIASIVGIPVAVVAGFIQLRIESPRKRTEKAAAAPAERDHSAHVAEPPAASIHPPLGRLPSHVHGRAEILDRLGRAITPGSGRIQVIVGLGGVGKTTLALKLAEDSRNRFSAVWWVNGADRVTFMTSMLGIAQHELNVPEPAVREAMSGRRNAADLFWNAIERTPVDGGRLLIIDNADDPQSVLTMAGDQVADGTGWIRVSRDCFVVVTSRDRAPATWGRLCELHLLGPLSPDAAADLLMDLVPGDDDRAAALAVGHRLFGLPLALHLAGIHISAKSSRHQTFSAYLDALYGDFASTVREQPVTPVRQGASDRHMITRTWELSLSTLADQGIEHARAAAGTLAELAGGQVVPMEMLRAELPARGRRGSRTPAIDAAALEGLDRTGLVDWSSPSEPRGIRMHDLVATTIRRQTPAPRRRSRSSWNTALHMLTAAAEALDFRLPGHWPVWRLLVAHFEALLSTSATQPKRDQRRLLELAPRLVAMLRLSNAWQEAERLGEVAIAAAGKLERSGAIVVGVQHNLATILQCRGLYRESEHLLRDVLRKREKILGRHHRETAHTRGNLAIVLSLQGRHGEALSIMKRDFRERTRLLGPEHPDTLRAGLNLADILRESGDLDAAELLMRRTLVAQERTLGSTYPDTLISRHNLARLLHVRGDFAAAADAYRDVQGPLEEVLGVSHEVTLGNLHHWGVLLFDQGQQAAAVHLLEQVLDSRRQALGPDHPDTQETAEALLAANDLPPCGDSAGSR